MYLEARDFRVTPGSFKGPRNTEPTTPISGGNGCRQGWHVRDGVMGSESERDQPGSCDEGLVALWGNLGRYRGLVVDQVAMRKLGQGEAARSSSRTVLGGNRKYVAARVRS